MNCGVQVKDKHNNLKWNLREVVIEDHVIVPCLSLSAVENPNFVNEYTSSLVTAAPLNPCRPLWEVHVLNVSSGDAAASLVFRIHHSLGDSVSMLSLVINSASKSADHNFSPTIPQHQSSDKRSTGFLQIVYDVVAGLWLTFLCLLQYGATLLWKRDRNLLIKDSTAKISSKRLAHVNLSIQDICLVKNTVNATLNDVIMGAVSAGFVRYMSRRQYKKMTTSNDPNASAEQHLPLNIRLRAIVAVNLRPCTVLEDLDKNMKNPSKAMWGNKVGFWMFSFPTLHYGDPLQYCRVTKMISRRKKSSYEASLTYGITKHMPTKVMAYIASKLCASTTVGFSNVMGPVEQIEYGDNPITHIIPTAHVNYRVGIPILCYNFLFRNVFRSYYTIFKRSFPYFMQSIVVHFISYAGKGKLVALVSEDIIPDPQQLCQDCADALQLMKEAAAKTTPSGSS